MVTLHIDQWSLDIRYTNPTLITFLQCKSEKQVLNPAQDRTCLIFFSFFFVPKTIFLKYYFLMVQGLRDVAIITQFAHIKMPSGCEKKGSPPLGPAKKFFAPP